MKTYFEIVKNNPLFAKIAFSDFQTMFNCLEAKELSYNKNEVILIAGDVINFIGIVLSGRLKIVKEDINGNQTIITEVFSTELFAEAFACAGIYHSPISIIASENCDILFLNYKKVIHTCNRSCMFHQRLIENMLQIVALKNLYLNQKIDIISKRTLREKLLSYFEYVGKGSKKFTISLNREELSSYVCADRSAVSNELSKMQKDGIIKYSKKDFEIL